MPPAKTGVAACSVDLVTALADEHAIDVFVDEPIAVAARAREAAGVRSAHEFLWRHRLDPYDLVVYQLGNSSAHDYLWPYLFRYPGLAVLHDARLHHARAASLLRLRRAADYRAEFTAAHPEVPAALAELAVAGFDSHLYYEWPMTRLVVRASRLTAVHTPGLARELLEQEPAAAVEAIRLGHGTPLPPEASHAASTELRARYRFPADAVVFGIFGGLTPEKRVPQVLDAFSALLPYVPSARLLLAGAPAAHYDVHARIAALDLGAHVTVTGYLEGDDQFAAHVAACDVSINLRWPTAREVSGPWLHALAAGRATITTDLAHTATVPALDPRTWTSTAGPDGGAPVTVAIDVLDEGHSLRLALRRLAADAALRERLGAAGATYWRETHSPAVMTADYRRVIARAIALPPPVVDLPAHLRDDGTRRLGALLEPFGLPGDVWSRI